MSEAPILGRGRENAVEGEDGEAAREQSTEAREKGEERKCDGRCLQIAGNKVRNLGGLVGWTRVIIFCVRELPNVVPRIFWVGKCLK
jgi:hypothetical protein